MRPRRFLPGWILLLICLAVPSGTAIAQPKTPDTPVPTVKEMREAHRSGRKMDWLLNQVSRTTQIAPSPILVMGIGGCRQYVMAKPADQGRLGFFANPWVFGSMLGISLLVICKDSLSVTLGPLKPVVDSMAELTHVAGALLGAFFLAAGIFEAPEAPPADSPEAPLVARESGKIAGPPNTVLAAPTSPVLRDSGKAAEKPEVPPASPGAGHYILASLTFIGALVVYAAVWIVFNMVEAVILINPIPALEVVLKSGRTFVIGFITLAAEIHPVLGFLVALPVILLSMYLAHFAIRLSVLSISYAFGILSRMFVKRQPHPDDKLWAFSSRHFTGVPLFTLGRLRPEDGGQWVFEYRRLLLVWTRVVTVPTENPLAIGIGSINPYVIAISPCGTRNLILLRFTPRYFGHHDHLRECLGVPEVLDISWTTSLKRAEKSAWAWIRGVAAPAETEAPTSFDDTRDSRREKRMPPADSGGYCPCGQPLSRRSEVCPSCGAKKKPPTPPPPPLPRRTRSRDE